MKQITEAEFTAQVIERAQMLGWIVAHFRPLKRSNGSWETPCQGDAAGFPDLFLLHPEAGHRVAFELKVGSNDKTPKQNAWLTAMELCGIPAFTWWPKDWDEIDQVLEHGAEPEPVESQTVNQEIVDNIFKALRCAA